MEQRPVPVLEPGALSLLYEYPFTGNIRELKNIVERADVLKDGNVITVQDLREALYPEDLEGTAPAPQPACPEELYGLSEPERLRLALQKCGGNRTKAAKLLGMDRSTLWRKLQKYQM